MMDLEKLIPILELSLSYRDKTDSILTVSLRDNNKAVREVKGNIITAFKKDIWGASTRNIFIFQNETSGY